MSVTDFVATLALVTAVVSITYTIIVDRRKPRLKVRGKIIHIFERTDAGMSQHGPFFDISATNHGPGIVYVRGVAVTHRSRLRRWYRKAFKGDTTQGAILDSLPESQDMLPKTLDVGESLSLLYPSDSEMLEENEIFDCLYLYDSLGGHHWAQKHVFREARSSLAKPDPMDTD